MSALFNGWDNIIVATLPDGSTPNAGWNEIGLGSAIGSGISATTGISSEPSAAVGPDNTLLVAWQEDVAGAYEIYIRTWTGTMWAEIGAGSATAGGISNTPGDSLSPSLAVGTDGNPIVVWQEDQDGGNEIHVRRWNGRIWEMLGNGPVNNTRSGRNPSLAISPDGFPIVAWQDNSSGNWEIFVSRWDGTAWTEVGAGSATAGGISNNTSVSLDPVLTIGSDGNPIVAWSNMNQGFYEIYILRFDGIGWVEVGTGSAAGGGISNNAGTSEHASLNIGADGKPVVVWQDFSSGDYEIYVRRWTGEAWDELGTSSASGGGISNNSGYSFRPSIAVGPSGELIIAWFDNSGGDSEIFLRRWNGALWAEMDKRSASGGGISDNAGDTRSPSATVTSNGTVVVAWSDTSSGNRDIYARQYGLTCYPLSLSVSGNGKLPATTPENSASCPSGQYRVGTTITLDAAPDDGWRVAGWIGTDNDTSNALTNIVTMPATVHISGVLYETQPVEPGNNLFLPYIVGSFFRSAVPR